jgi:hypothetical protein
MSPNTLKWVRLVAPGIIILALGYPFYSIILQSSKTNPLPNETIFMGVALVLGAMYYASPLRLWSNYWFHDDVNRNLVELMVRPAFKGGLVKKDPTLVKFDEVRDIFYHFVDTEPSLKNRAEQAYFNGAIWTTIADVRALSLLFFIAYGLIWLFFDRNGAAGLWAIICGLLFVISVPLSISVTRVQTKIGASQVEFIYTHKKPELENLLTKKLS